MNSSTSSTPSSDSSSNASSTPSQESAVSKLEEVIQKTQKQVARVKQEIEEAERNIVLINDKTESLLEKSNNQTREIASLAQQALDAHQKLVKLYGQLQIQKHPPALPPNNIPKVPEPIAVFPPSQPSSLIERVKLKHTYLGLLISNGLTRGKQILTHIQSQEDYILTLNNYIQMAGQEIQQTEQQQSVLLEKNYASLLFTCYDPNKHRHLLKPFLTALGKEIHDNPDFKALINLIFEGRLEILFENSMIKSAYPILEALLQTDLSKVKGSNENIKIWIYNLALFLANHDANNFRRNQPLCQKFTHWMLQDIDDRGHKNPDIIKDPYNPLNIKRDTFLLALGREPGKLFGPIATPIENKLRLVDDLNKPTPEERRLWAQSVMSQTPETRTPIQQRFVEKLTQLLEEKNPTRGENFLEQYPAHSLQEQLLSPFEPLKVAKMRGRAYYPARFVLIDVCIQDAAHSKNFTDLCGDPNFSALDIPYSRRLVNEEPLIEELDNFVKNPEEVKNEKMRKQMIEKAQSALYSRISNFMGLLPTQSPADTVKRLIELSQKGSIPPSILQVASQQTGEEALIMAQLIYYIAALSKITPKSRFTEIAPSSDWKWLIQEFEGPYQGKALLTIVSHLAKDSNFHGSALTSIQVEWAEKVLQAVKAQGPTPIYADAGSGKTVTALFAFKLFQHLFPKLFLNKNIHLLSPFATSEEGMECHQFNRGAKLIEIKVTSKEHLKDCVLVDESHALDPDCAIYLVHGSERRLVNPLGMTATPITPYDTYRENHRKIEQTITQKQQAAEKRLSGIDTQILKAKKRHYAEHLRNLAQQMQVEGIESFFSKENYGKEYFKKMLEVDETTVLKNDVWEALNHKIKPLLLINPPDNLVKLIKDYKSALLRLRFEEIYSPRMRQFIRMFPAPQTLLDEWEKCTFVTPAFITLLKEKRKLIRSGQDLATPPEIQEKSDKIKSAQALQQQFSKSGNNLSEFLQAVDELTKDVPLERRVSWAFTQFREMEKNNKVSPNKIKKPSEYNYTESTATPFIEAVNALAVQQPAQQRFDWACSQLKQIADSLKQKTIQSKNDLYNDFLNEFRELTTPNEYTLDNMKENPIPPSREMENLEKTKVAITTQLEAWKAKIKKWEDRNQSPEKGDHDKRTYANLAAKKKTLFEQFDYRSEQLTPYSPQAVHSAITTYVKNPTKTVQLIFPDVAFSDKDFEETLRALIPCFQRKPLYFVYHDSHSQNRGGKYVVKVEDEQLIKQPLTPELAQSLLKQDRNQIVLLYDKSNMQGGDYIALSEANVDYPIQQYLFYNLKEDTLDPTSQITECDAVQALSRRRNYMSDLKTVPVVISSKPSKEEFLKIIQANQAKAESILATRNAAYKTANKIFKNYLMQSKEGRDYLQSKKFQQLDRLEKLAGMQPRASEELSKLATTDIQNAFREGFKALLEPPSSSRQNETQQDLNNRFIQAVTKASTIMGKMAAALLSAPDESGLENKENDDLGATTPEYSTTNLTSYKRKEEVELYITWIHNYGEQARQGRS